MQNEPLPTIFPCLFCNHEKSVTVKIDKKGGVGNLSCKVCNQQFQCAVNCTLTSPPTRLDAEKNENSNADVAIPTDLSAAVDVYADWVDACDAVAKEGGAETGEGYAPTRSPVEAGRLVARHRSVDDDDDNGGAEDDNGMNGYGGEGIVADDEDY